MTGHTADILDLAREYLEKNRRTTGNIRLVDDTTDFFRVEVNSVLAFDHGSYLITGHAREGRFGLDDEAKPWVKTAVDLATGRRKIIKLVFYEKFRLRVGNIEYDCFRSPRKEARILDLARGREGFMQGIHTEDSHGNNVRILDYLPGPTFSRAVAETGEDFDVYFHRDLPRLLRLFRESVAAVGFLHHHGEKHGDIRRDHLLFNGNGNLAWIDFDYNYRHGEYIAGLDLFGLGNVLAYVVGRGDRILRDIYEQSPGVFETLTLDDMNLVYKHRLMNLQKLFPQVPDSLNRVLLRFSAGTEVFYDSVDEMLDELDRAIEELPEGEDHGPQTNPAGH